MKILAALLFVGLVVAANALTAAYGMVGGWVTAGTFAAGLTFAVRDVLHTAGGRRVVLGAIVAGAVLSAALVSVFGTGGAPISAWRLAAASCAAFLVSELADLAVWEPLRGRRPYLAMLLSNAVGAVVDSVLFLWLAGFDVSAWGTQALVKVGVTLPLIAVVLIVRRTRPRLSLAR